MNDKKKAIVIGEYSRVEYHPLKGVDKELERILSGFRLEFTEEYDRFRAQSLAQYDLCLSFTDHWKEKLSDEQTAGLLSFVCNGGGLLAIHNGIAIQNRFELAQLCGGKFIRHPEQKLLDYRPAATGHEILDGIEGFSFVDEPYQFELDPFTEKTMLLEYESEGSVWPSAWAIRYGLGRVVYLSPGHNAEAYSDPMFGKLIERSALWAIGKL
jgi:type 1 glutamine amidotransferase